MMAKKVKKSAAPATAAAAALEGKKTLMEPVGKEGLAELAAPLVSASLMQIAVAGNEVVLVFLRNRPMAGTTDGQMTVAQEPTVMVQMSRQTLKDLSLVTAKVVSDLEKEWGEIETGFTRKLAATH